MNPDWVTYSQFVEYTEQNDGRFELIDGIIYKLASPAFTHQRISKDIHEAFMMYCRDLDGCDTFAAPFDIKCVREEREEVPDDDKLEYFTCVVQPDLMIFCDYEKDINERDMYDGTPTIVIEILSPSNSRKDVIKKEAVMT
ncbi:MAG TPA: hypothetical protein DCO79_12665 [Spirochaeta sp.]|nr:hypothetical protein [Spirochaeta sp.]